jgi:tetratricopeptide (TPR) repeat protein
MMASAAPLSTIIALARAGALDHAWYQFGAAGYAAREDDPAALTVKGRLLKDRALRASGDERRRLYLESSEAYRRAAALQPGTYPLINAATLSLLSSDVDQAREIAREVLDRIAREPEEPETPYWRAATEAEALLVLGRTEEARRALETAVAAAPLAWEDHASTLRQFLAIQEALGGETAWLDMLRPPRSVHFAGTGEIAPDDVADFLERSRVGFGFGALGTGAELVVAEALLAGGGALHVVLPCDPASFAAERIDPAGGDWRARFDAALEAAESVQLVRPLGGAPAPEAMALAGEIALGGALLNAERLMGEAFRLVVQDGAISALPAEDGTTEWRQAPLDSGTNPLSLLAIAVGGAAEAGFEARLQEVRLALAEAEGAQLPPHLGGECVLVGYRSPGEAAAAARLVHARLRDHMPLRIAGHHGLIACVRDPFLGALRPAGSGAQIVEEIAASIPAGTICVSGDFAAVLAATAGGPREANAIGELQAFDGGSPIGLYALRT